MSETYSGFEYADKPEKAKGQNVTIRSLFLRHSEKEYSTHTAETTLSDHGRELARNVGRELGQAVLRKPYSSDADRAKETAELIVSESKTIDRRDLSVRKDLGVVYDQEGEFARVNQKLKQEIIGDNPEDLNPAEKAEKYRELGIAQADYYHDFKEERPDFGTFSPIEASSLLAQRIDRNIRMADKLDSGSDIELINITHDIPIGAILARLFGFTSIREIGGPIDFVEGFQILVHIDEQGGKKVNLTILRRDQEEQLIEGETITLDPKMIREIANETRGEA